VGVSATEATANAAESVRHGLLGTSPQSAAAEIEEWESIVAEYGRLHLCTQPATLLRSYLTDLHQLSIALSGRRDSPSTRSLHRAGALLTALTAWTYGNLGAPDQAGRWWRTSHHLADVSGDTHTQVWVSAQQIVMALYQRSHDLRMILEAIERTEPLAATVAFTPGTAWLYCGKAQALGLSGRAQEAEAALHTLRDIYAGLDSIVTSDRDSFLGWPETRLRYTESFTYAHLGDYPSAATAQDHALALYAPTVRRDPVKIELQRALCLARSGAANDAARHACQQLTALDEQQHDLPMVALTQRVLACLPAGRMTEETAELRRYVAGRPALMRS
jgi:hypothetical protein